MIYLCEKSRKTSSTETEIILVVAKVGGMREVGRKMLNAYRILFGEWWKCFGTRRWLHNIVNIPNAIESFTLKCLILCYTDFTSINYVILSKFVSYSLFKNQISKLTLTCLKHTCTHILIPLKTPDIKLQFIFICSSLKFSLCAYVWRGKVGKKQFSSI